MSGDGNGKPRLYQVSYSVSVAKGIQELGYQAFLQGQREQFNAAIGVVMRRLRHDPWGFGELVASLNHLKARRSCRVSAAGQRPIRNTSRQAARFHCEGAFGNASMT
jgi:hypothetical protein